MNRIEQRLQKLHITLPPANAPRGSYVPYVISQGHVYIAGQGPRLDGKLQFTGKVGHDLSIEEGRQAARICGLNILSHLQAACGGDLNRVVRAVRVAGLVNCTPEFTEHPTVINGASDLFHEIFGEKGLHARIATGAISLPFDMAVEIEALFEIA